MKKKIIVIVIIIVILSIITIILTKEKNKNHKTLTQYNYIIEKETDYMEHSDDRYVGKLPIINLNSEEVQKINNEIMKEYYECAFGEDDFFYYEYSMYKDVLSLYIRIIREDDSEYGSIVKYLIYNINVKTEKELSTDEVLKYLNISKDEYNKKIDKRLRDYYENDSLKTEMSYDEYVDHIYNPDDNRIAILDNKVYVCNAFNLTDSLLDYEEDINEIEIEEIK